MPLGGKEMPEAKITTLADSIASVEQNLFSTATYVLIFAGLVAAIALGRQDIRWTLVVAALLCGWSEVNGLCGTSHIGTLTPMRAMRPSTLWPKAVSAYTVAGAL